MGRLDRKIDPITGSFIAAPGGKFVECDVLENQILFSFLVQLKRWEGDPEFGNQFAELARALDTSGNRQRLADLANACLAWLVSDGSLDSVSVTVEQYDAGVVAFKVLAYQPGQTTATVLPTYLVPVGGNTL